MGARKRAKKAKAERNKLGKGTSNGALAFFLRVNAVWFDGTMLDTNDISTVRGASLALLFAPDCLLVHLQQVYSGRCQFTAVISGASTLMLECTPGESGIVVADLAGEIDNTAREYLSGKQQLTSSDGSAGQKFNLANLRFTISLVPAVGLGKLENIDKSLTNKVQLPVAMLNALAARQQYQMPSIIIPQNLDKSHNPENVCQLDHVSPVFGRDRTLPLSEPVLERRQFGRDQKEQFYFSVLKFADNQKAKSLVERLKPLKFSQSLGDLLASPPGAEGEVGEQPDILKKLPVSLSGKIAVIHLDGNKFGSILAGIDHHGKLASFSKDLRRLQANMLVELLEWCVPEGCCTSQNNDFIAPAMDSKVTGFLDERVRLETLLWGGDEMVFALPAWRGWEAVGVLERALRKFVIEDAGFGDNKRQRSNDLNLTHAIGLSFANVKTPIRLLKTMAGMLADSAKQPSQKILTKTSFGYQVGVVESVDNPDGDIIKLRNAEFGLSGDSNRLVFTGSPGRPTAVAATSDLDWDNITAKLVALGSILSASQVSVLITKAEEIGLDTIYNVDGQNDWLHFLDTQLDRILMPNTESIITVKSLLQDPAIGGDETMLIPIQWLRYLRDYIFPKNMRKPSMWPKTSSELDDADVAT